MPAGVALTRPLSHAREARPWRCLVAVGWGAAVAARLEDGSDEDFAIKNWCHSGELLSQYPGPSPVPQQLHKYLSFESIISGNHCQKGQRLRPCTSRDPVIFASATRKKNKKKDQTRPPSARPRAGRRWTLPCVIPRRPHPRDWACVAGLWSATSATPAPTALHRTLPPGSPPPFPTLCSCLPKATG